MSSARTRLLRLFLPLTLLLAVSAPSADRTPAVVGDLAFSALDGSLEDLDAAVDGVWTVPHSMVLEGRLSCGDDGSSCAMRLDVRGDFVIRPGAGIEAGKGLEVVAAGDVIVHQGAFVVAERGEVVLSARGQLEIDGLVSAGGRAGKKSRRASVSLESTGGSGKGVRVGTTSTVLSTGGSRGRNRIEIAGCGIEVLGLVASVASGPGAGVVLRSCEGLTVDGRDLGRGPSVGGRMGRIQVSGGGDSEIALFAEGAVILDGSELRVTGGAGDRISATSELASLSWRNGRGSVGSERKVPLAPGAPGAIRLTACEGVQLAASRFAPADSVEIVEACAGEPKSKSDRGGPAPGLVSLPEVFSGAAPADNPGPLGGVVACTPNLAVDNLILSGFDEFIACNELTSANTRIIPRGRVIYRAGQSIVLFDGFSVEGSSEFTAIIDPTLNQPPVITSDGGGATAMVSVAENTTPVTDVDSFDPEGETEGGGGLTYSLSGDDAALFTLDMDSGVLDFLAAPDFETPGDANMDNDYEVTVTVTDSFGGTGTQDITVTVTDVVDTGTIEIVKATLPAGATGFGFTGDIGMANVFSLDDGQTQTFTLVVPGTYTVTEDDPTPAYDLSDLTCTDPDTGSTTNPGTREATIDLDAGETVTCTFTNTKRGTIEITKVTTPAGGTGFGFTGNIGMANVFSLDDGQTQTFTDVVPGAYLVTEDDPTPAFDLTGLTCVDPDSGSVTSLGTRAATIDLDAGETVSCVFTNTQRGSIVVEKQTDPDSATGVFNFTGDASGMISDDGTIVVMDLMPGTYTSTEADPTVTPGGFDLTGISCDDGASATASTFDVGTRTATFEVDPGETVTCVFTNTQRGSIVVEKQTDPDSATGVFNFTGDAAGMISDDGTIVVMDLVPGTYTSTEADPTVTPGGFDLTGISCDDGASATASTFDVGTRTATFEVDPGETVTCVFTNTQRGSIVVEKQTDPDSATGVFNFTGDASGMISDDGTIVVMDLLPGTYTSTEADPTVTPGGFDLTDITCDDGASATASTFDVGTRTATFEVDPGETVTCVFTNTQRGSIVVEKQTDPDGATGDFVFTGDAMGTISDDGTIVVMDLVPGTYTSTESDPTVTPGGFDLTGISCDDGASATASTFDVGTRTATFEVDPGETVTCVFTNSQRGSIAITKATIPAAGTGFGFTDDIAAPNSFSLDDGQTETFLDVVPGVYSVSETNLPGGGWSLDSATCSDGSPVTAIDLGPGEAITCTFNNVQGGTIIIAKSTLPAAGTGFVFMQNMDASGNFTLGDGQMKTFTAVPAGTYAVSETPATGWALSTATCSDASPISAIVLSNGETVTCTFNNVNTPPMGGADSFDFVGNTLLLVDKTTSGVPEIIATTTGGTTPAADGVLDNDSDPEGAAVAVSGIFASMVDCPDMTAPFTDCPTVNGGKVTMEANGQFSYTPKAGDLLATDMFGYKLSDGLNTADVVVTLNRKNRVWYVENDSAAGGDGTSADPFDTLAEASAASLAADTIFVLEGDATTAGQDAGITLKSMQRFLGEGVALAVPDTVNGVVGPTLFAAGNKPLVEHGTAMSDGITVDAAAADHVGIEIRGLTLSGARNAIDVTSAGTFAVGITITDNLFDDSGAEAIDLNPGGSGDFIATIEDNTFSTSSPTGNAIDITTTVSAGDVEVAINRNTDVTSSGGTAINVNGSAGGNVFVTGFADNTVNGATGGTGISILGATFDSDTSDADFDEVDAGTTTVGSGGDPVGGSGVILGSSAAAANRVSGNLLFDQLDVFASSGTILGASGSAQASGGDPPTAGFELNVTTGTLTGFAKGLELDLLTAATTFTTLVSTNSPTQGIDIASVTGTVMVGGGSIVGSTGTAFDVGDTGAMTGGNANITYGGSITNTTGRAVEIQRRTGGTITVSGNITETGDGIHLANNDAGSNTITFSGTTKTVNTGAGGGVFLNNNTGATLNFTGGGLDIDTTTGTGFFATGGGTVNVSGAANSITTVGPAGGVGLSLDGIAIGANDITFASIMVTNTNSTGVIVNNTSNGGTLNGGNVTVNGAALNGINITNSSAAFNFTSATIDSTTGFGIGLTGANGVVTFTTVDIDGTGTQGVLVNGNTNAVSINGGSIGSSNDPAGNAVFVNAGNGNVSVAATIDNATARAVEVTGRTGGTVTFSGAIDEDGTGINLDSNGAGTVTFSGGMTIDTGPNIAFNATGGGTVNVTGTNTIGASTVSTTTAINIVSTNIGASDVTFQSVSSNGATTGIVLNTTGSAGGLTITGDGSTATQGGNDSGGIIQNTSGDGVVLTSTSSVTLQNMTIGDPAVGTVDTAYGTNNIGGDGIDATGVVGLTLKNVTIARTAGHGLNATGATPSLTDLVVDDSLILNAGDGNEEHGLNLDELRGDNFVRRSLFDGFNETGIELINATGMVDLTVDDTTFQDNKATNGNFGEEAILIEAQGTASIVALVTGNANLNLTKSIFDDLESQSVDGKSLGTASVLHLTVENTKHIESGSGDAIIIMNPDGGGSGNLTVKNNSFDDTTLGPFAILAKNDSSGALDATIQGNTVTDMQLLNVNHDDVGGSGAANGTSRVQVGGFGAGEANVNTVGSENIGIDVIATETGPVGSDPDVSLTIENNTITLVKNFTFCCEGIRIQAQNNTRMDVDIDGNTANGDNLSGLQLQELDSAVIGIEGFAGGTSAAAVAFVDALNTFDTEPSFFSAGNFDSGNAAAPIATTRPSP